MTTDAPAPADRAPYAVGLIQTRMGPDPAANLEKAARLVRAAAAEGARVICLPELFRTHYLCQRETAEGFDLAETIPGPSTEVLGAAARETGTVVIASLFEKRAAGLYHNTAAVLGTDGALLGIYRKMHIPDDPAYYEKYYFAPGDLGFRTFPTPWGRIGVLVCWDQWYPEAARLTALRGAEILFYPTAIGWHPAERASHGARQRDAWRTIQRGHAVANGVYVAAVNRVGHEAPDADADGITFWGGSFLADPFGGLVEEASETEEEILISTVDPAGIEEIRRGWPFLRDRRIDAYGDLARRYLDGGA